MVQKTPPFCTLTSFLHVLLLVEHQLHIYLLAGTQWRNKKITGQHALFLQNNPTEACTIIPSISPPSLFKLSQTFLVCEPRLVLYLICAASASGRPDGLHRHFPIKCKDRQQGGLHFPTASQVKFKYPSIHHKFLRSFPKSTVT